MKPSKRNVENRLDNLEEHDRDDEGGILVYDSTEAEEPACVIGVRNKTDRE